MDVGSFGVVDDVLDDQVLYVPADFERPEGADSPPPGGPTPSGVGPGDGLPAGVPPAVGAEIPVFPRDDFPSAPDPALGG